jgi:Outer membrane protein beta-barrel family/Carboxypeptidase regulatory-like domain
MKKTVSLLLFLFFTAITIAQTGKTIRGLVKDSSKTVLADVTVTMINTNNPRDISKAITDGKGEFTFSNASVVNFKITVSGIGFAPYSKIFHYPATATDIDLGTIELSSRAKLLEEVIITADRTVTIKEDTIEFKADSFKLRPEDDVEALLKKIPGVQVDANGNITAYGKSVTKIRVNGKDFFSGDIKTATKELPANIVEAVQVIDDYGDQAAFTGVKDGDPQKIINLKIKKDKNKGYFGRGQAGYGTDDRYTMNGSVNYFNNNKQISVLANFNNNNTSTFNLPRPGGSGGMRPGNMDNSTMNSLNTVMTNGDIGFVQNGQASNDGINRTNSLGINFRDDWGKKLSVYGSYTFTDRETVTKSSTQQTFLFNNGNIINNQNSDKTENSTNHRVYLNTEWKIDSFNQVKISPVFTYTKSHSTTLNDFQASNNSSTKLNEGNSIETINTVQPNISGTLLYNHRFRRMGRLLSATASAGFNSSDQDDDFINNSTNYQVSGGGNTVLNQHQFITQYNTNPSRSIRLSYIEPLSKKRSLEFNYTNSYSFTDNDRQTNQVNGTSSNRIDSLSNIYENTFTYNRYGINFRYNDKKYNYSIGLAAQSNTMKGESFITKSNFKQNTFNWFPQARFTYNFSRTKNISVNYNSTVSAPSYSQLQPVYDYSNPQYPSVGNPDLKPEFKNTLLAQYGSFNFLSGKILFSNISYTFSKDKVATNTINKAGSGSGALQETQYRNTDGYYSASGFFVFSQPFKKRKYVLTMNGNLSYTNNISFINSEKNTSRNLIATQGFTTDITLKKWLETGIGGSFTFNENKNSLTPKANTAVRTYTITSSGKIYFPGKLVLNYDLNKSFNNGFGVSGNPFIINGYLEKQFTKNNRFTLRLQAFDLLNQNTSISRTVNANSITDTRTNRLGRYFMLSVNFLLQKFKGAQPKMQFPSGPPPEGGMPGMRSNQ